MKIKVNEESRIYNAKIENLALNLLNFCGGSKPTQTKVKSYFKKHPIDWVCCIADEQNRIVYMAEQFYQETLNH